MRLEISAESRSKGCRAERNQGQGIQGWRGPSPARHAACTGYLQYDTLLGHDWNIQDVLLSLLTYGVSHPLLFLYGCTDMWGMDMCVMVTGQHVGQNYAVSSFLQAVES